MSIFNERERESKSPLNSLFNSSSFTLIELLIVIAILVILAVVVILTLNPQELLAQARDSQRISDMATLKSALGLFLVDTAGKGFMGTSSIVYVSIPDTASSTCGDLGLPSLSSGYSYKCSTLASSSLTDGTGWLPINFNSVSSGSPLPKIPTDPTNSSSTGLYYTYVTDGGGNFEITSLFESTKYTYLMTRDGGPSDLQYEAGNNLSLSPFVRGVNGLWSLEGSGNDLSGYGINLLASTTTSTNPTYAAGVIGLAASFQQTNHQYLYNNYLSTSSTLLSLPSGNSPRTMGGWVYPLAPVGNVWQPVIFFYGYFSTSTSDTAFGLITDSENGANPNTLYFAAVNDDYNSMVPVPYNQWSHVAVTYDGNKNIYLYLNGNLIGTHVETSYLNTYFATGGIASGFEVGSSPELEAALPYIYSFNGLIDELFIYNYALTANQINQIYNAQKPR